MSLRDRAVHGVIWTGIGTIGAGVLNFVLTMILARVLSPSDYGLLELLVIFTVLSECFIDSGFSQAVIRDQHASQTDLSSVFFFNLIIAIFLYVVLFIVAPLIANFYHEPQLINLSRFVFLVIIFHSLSIIQNANFSRNLQFRPQAIASISAIIIAGVIAGIMAFRGYGVWSLAINMVLYAFLKMLFFWLLSSWRPSLSFSIDSIKKYFKFGSNLLIQGLFDRFVTNMESLMIGRVYTKTSLGYFSQARKLDSYIAQTSNSVIQKVTYPILAKLGDNEESLKQGYRRVLGITMFIIVPLLFFVIASAPNMLYVFFGPQWEQSIPYLRLWSICGLLVSFHSIFINIFLVRGKTKQLLNLSLLKQLIRILIVFSLINIGIMALMWGIVGASVFSAIIYCFYGGKLIQYRLVEVTKDMLPTFLTALLSATIVWTIGMIFSTSNHYFVFSAQIITMITIYTISSRLYNISSFREISQITHSLIKKKNI